MTNQSTTKKKEDPKRSETPKGKPEEPPKVESHPHFGEIKHEPGIMKFLIEFSSAEGELRGTITHLFSDNQGQFTGFNLEEIGQFMRRCLPHMEKKELAAGQQEEVKETPPSDMRTRSFDVITKGTDHPRRVLQKGQPFELKWSFEAPSLSSMQGQQMNYRVIICRKTLEGSKREVLGDTEGKIDFGGASIFSFPSEPLPVGTYHLEGEANFWSLKSKKPIWRSSCSESCMIVVN